MFEFRFKNYETTGIKKGNLKNILASFLKKNLGFYNLVDRINEHKSIQDFSNNLKGTYDHVVVLGIGGSALGIKTIRDTLIEKNDRDKLRIIDNVDPDFVYENTYDLNLDRTIFVVITKSGGTAETMSLFMHMKDKVEQKGLNWNEKFVFVTDPVSGTLREIADRDQVPTFEVPPNVGGRYSVLSAVGLVPACLAGVDINKLLDGAKKMRDILLNEDESLNLCYQMALFQAINHQQGININVLFPYSNKLLRFGDWYTQLLAESIGKSQEVGLTPVTAVGATDQHSQLQLYSDGPDDKMYQFIEVRRFKNDMKISVDETDDILSNKFEFLEGVSFAELLNTELKGTLDSLKERKRPILKIEISEVNASNLGALFMMYEGATALLGEMLEIDAFNQPGVERSKVLTKAHLAKRND